MPLEALLIPENLTDSDSDGIGGGTGCNFIFFTVPTTCSWPSIEMVGFMYVCITVPTTCSRPSIEMVGFIIIIFFFSVFTLLARPFYIKRSNMAQRC